MGIQLAKGGNINLSKTAPSLKKVRFGLGWGQNLFNTGHSFDLDGSVFVCKDDPSAPAGARLISDKHFIFYNNLTDPSGAIVHSGDNQNGNAPGDDESVTIDLAMLPAEVTHLSFIATIHEAEARKQNFGQVSGAAIRLYDDTTGAELAHYDLEGDYAASTAIQFGSLVRRDNGDWMFKAVGGGFTEGLGSFVQMYGGNLA